jgi:DNA-binding ferritin-like protein
MQQISSNKNNGTESSYAELHASFQAQYEKFLQDTRDEIAERSQKMDELKHYRSSMSRSKFAPLKSTFGFPSSS